MPKKIAKKVTVVGRGKATKKVMKPKISLTDHGEFVKRVKKRMEKSITVKDKAAKLDESEFLAGSAAGDLDMPMVGIAYPSFCWEMFTGQSILPLSSLYALGGLPGTYKSHLAAEFSRWIAMSGGRSALFENEHKAIPDLFEAVGGIEAAKSVSIFKCNSFDMVQNMMQTTRQEQDLCQKEQSQAFLQIVDSIVGNSSQDEQVKLAKEGVTNRGFPVVALAASRFLSAYTGYIVPYPYIAVFVTHITEKPGDNPYTPTEINLKGGGEWMYRCRMAIITNRSGSVKQNEDGIKTTKVTLTLKKDMGNIVRRLPVAIHDGVRVLQKPGSDDPIQQRVVKFSWDAATLSILEKPENSGYPKNWATMAKDIMGLETVKVGIRNFRIAPKLGITMTNVEEFGTPKGIVDALYNTPSVLNLLRAEMGIAKGLVFKSGDDYDTLRREAKAIAKERMDILSNSEELVVLREPVFPD